MGRWSARATGSYFPPRPREMLIHKETVMVTTQDYDNTLVTSQSPRRQVVAGPSREELFDALRLRHEGRKVAFTVAPSHITDRVLPGGRKFVPGNLMFHVGVGMLRPESGDGNNWLFELGDEHKSLGSTKLHGYINTTTRQGWVEPVID